jgi:hypothetical protein
LLIHCADAVLCVLLPQSAMAQSNAAMAQSQTLPASASLQAGDSKQQQQQQQQQQAESAPYSVQTTLLVNVQPANATGQSEVPLLAAGRLASWCCVADDWQWFLCPCRPMSSWQFERPPSLRWKPNFYTRNFRWMVSGLLSGICPALRCLPRAAVRVWRSACCAVTRFSSSLTALVVTSHGGRQSADHRMWRLNSLCLLFSCRKRRASCVSAFPTMSSP